MVINKFERNSSLYNNIQVEMSTEEFNQIYSFLLYIQQQHKLGDVGSKLLKEFSLYIPLINRGYITESDIDRALSVVPQKD